MRKIEAVKYIAYDRKEFNTEKECKDYEQYVGADLIAATQNVKDILKELDNFCDLWTKNCANCSTCPIQDLCELRDDMNFESYFSNRYNPFDYCME